MAVHDKANYNLKTLDSIRKQQEILSNKVNDLHQKIVQNGAETAVKYGEKMFQKVRNLLAEGKNLAEEEETVSKALISQLDSLMQAAQNMTNRKRMGEVSEQKRKRIKADADPSRLTSPASVRASLEHVNVVVGDQVAARVRPDDAEKDEWIVVKVIHYDKDTAKYEVIDEEPGDDDESGQRKYKLPPSCIIPFPKSTDPSSAPEFPVRSQVLAVYPGTTALYKATVVVSHHKKKIDEYLLEFDDDEEDGELPKRSVPFYHVVPLPEGHRQ
eukprot:TRINITY_DN8174_c0_g1_i1.p1 TRINITY_DN8174_c0_g1~~TRINITY_DN8174_c0_g1_i1.p1  ORF type:complete len:271 (+),score=70.97 TRINITY_DN8174_c0_g1_i1:222-1034(+)